MYTDPSGESFLGILSVIASVGILIADFFAGDHEPRNVNFSNNNPSSTAPRTLQKNNIGSNISGEPIKSDRFEIPNGVRVSSTSINLQNNQIAHSLFPNDWIKNRYGAYLWNDSAVDQASTRAGWEYVGKELPAGVHRSIF